MTLGIIDVGTNSIHLLIGIITLTGRFHVILKEKDLTRLGEGGLSKKVLAPAAMRRAMGVLQRYAATLDRSGVDRVEAVATSAVREAGNGREFVRRVRRQLGLPLRIISGREEARMVYLGVLQARRPRHPMAVINIGGGSAQVICGKGSRLLYAASVQLGGARLTETFIRHDPATPDEVAALRAHVRRAWAPVVRQMRRHRWSQAFGSSATILDLMAGVQTMSGKPMPRKKHGLTLSQSALRTFQGWLSRSGSLERIQTAGMDPRREDLALAAATVLLEWMEGCRIPALQYTRGSIREGLVVDYLIRHYQGKVPRIENPLVELLGLNGKG